MNRRHSNAWSKATTREVRKEGKKKKSKRDVKLYTERKPREKKEGKNNKQTSPGKHVPRNLYRLQLAWNSGRKQEDGETPHSLPLTLFLIRSLRHETLFAN